MHNFNFNQDIYMVWYFQTSAQCILHAWALHLGHLLCKDWHSENNLTSYFPPVSQKYARKIPLRCTWLKICIELLLEFSSKVSMILPLWWSAVLNFWGPTLGVNLAMCTRLNIKFWKKSLRVNSILFKYKYIKIQTFYIHNTLHLKGIQK